MKPAALAFEVMVPAQSMNMTDQVFQYAIKYLDRFSLSENVTTRLTHPAVHAPRRTQELTEIIGDLEALGFDPVLTRAIRDVHKRLADLGTREALNATVPDDWRYALRVVAELEERRAKGKQLERRHASG